MGRWLAHQVANRSHQDPRFSRQGCPRCGSSAVGITATFGLSVTYAALASWFGRAWYPCRCGHFCFRSSAPPGWAAEAGRGGGDHRCEHDQHHGNGGHRQSQNRRDSRPPGGPPSFAVPTSYGARLPGNRLNSWFGDFVHDYKPSMVRRLLTRDSADHPIHVVLAPPLRLPVPTAGQAAQAARPWICPVFPGSC